VSVVSGCSSVGCLGAAVVSLSVPWWSCLPSPLRPGLLIGPLARSLALVICRSRPRAVALPEPAAECPIHAVMEPLAKAFGPSLTRARGGQNRGFLAFIGRGPLCSLTSSQPMSTPPSQGGTPSGGSPAAIFGTDLST
jgi:hypothetical protein